MTTLLQDNAGRIYAPWAASWRWTALLIAAIALARLAYLAWLCPYTLLEDEAHYWEWSRNLDWSYYSKPAGIAWLIAASSALLGESEFAVRAPAVFGGAAFALVAAWLAREVTGERRAGFFAAALVHLVPMFQSTSLLTSIDMPYAVCWTLAALGVWRGVVGGERRWTLAAGLAAAAGLCFKQTMLLWFPGLILAAWWASRHRNGGRRGVWLRGLVVAGVAMAGLLPNVIWNAQRDWPTVRHLLGHLGMPGGDVVVAPSGQPSGYDPAWTLEFLGTQLALVGPTLLLVGLGWRRMADRPEARRFLAFFAFPILLFYLAVSLKTEPEGNWAYAGYCTLVPLAAIAVVRGMDEFCGALARWKSIPTPRPKAGFLLRRPETPAQVLWHATIAFGLLSGFGMLRLDWIARAPVVGERIPLSRLVGADQMAAHVERLREDLRTRTPGMEPLVISQFYGRASQLAFYLPGNPIVYCSGSRMGGRKSQYDLWAHTDLSDPSLAGRPAVLLGDAGQDWSWGFDRVEPVGRLEGDRKRNREAFLGFGYRPPRSTAP